MGHNSDNKNGPVLPVVGEVSGCPSCGVDSLRLVELENLKRLVSEYVEHVPCSCGQVCANGVRSHMCWRCVFEYNLGFCR